VHLKSYLIREVAFGGRDKGGGLWWEGSYKGEATECVFNVISCLKSMLYHLNIFQPSTPTKPVVFADWLAGVSPPDPNTINKHVYDMVEVSQIHEYDVVKPCYLKLRNVISMNTSK
jgi:hypothetical protein